MQLAFGVFQQKNVNLLDLESGAAEKTEHRDENGEYDSTKNMDST